MTVASATGPQATPTQRSRLAWLWARHPLWLAFTLTAVVTTLRLRDTVDSDVAWQLWIAHHIHAGANLYTDIVEVNPPLWFWMALPVDRLASLFHVLPETALLVAIAGFAALALAATDLLLNHFARPRRTLFLGYAALTLMAMPWMHVGQREQIILIGTPPYAALLAARHKGKVVPLWLAFAIGLGFGLGVGLKHYFLIVPVLLELWLIAGARQRWRLIRPETVAVVCVGLVYAAAVILFEQDFIRNTIPMVRLAYGVTGAPGIRYLFGPYAVTALVTAAFAVAHYRLLPKGSLSSVLLASAVAFAIVYFIQSKGWLYHAIPMLGCASLAVAAMLAEIEVAPAVLRVLSPALLMFPFVLAGEDRAHPLLPSTDLIGAVDHVGSGEAVGFLTVEPAIPWSITLQRGFRYPSRYIGYWMMRAIIDNERHGSPNPRLTALGKDIVAKTVNDFECVPPRRLVVAGPRWGGENFDILTFFERDPQFTALMLHYRLRSRSYLDSYELASPLPAPTRPCRRGV